MFQTTNQVSVIFQTQQWEVTDLKPLLIVDWVNMIDWKWDWLELDTCVVKMGVHAITHIDYSLI